MNIMELSSAEKRREANIRKNREFQMLIRFTSLVENRVALLARIALNGKLLKLHQGDHEELKNKSKRKEIEKKKRR